MTLDSMPQPELRVRLQRALQATLGDTYDCTRVWSAWGYGTMDENDFVPVLDRMDEIIDELVAQITVPTCPECQGERPVDAEHCQPCTNWLMGKEP